MKSAAITYAHSLFSLAKEENKEQEIFEELTELVGIFTENPEYTVLLDSPTVNVSERCNLVDEAFSACGEYVKNFLKILCEKKYIHIFPECVKEYEKQYNKKLGIEKVTAITAVPLSDELREKLIKKLEKDTGKTIALEQRVDKSILGGIILRTENSQTDASVRARLEGIRTELSSQ
ncbi:MAG: ATP synthase F1 subunit delta [Clostridia bacterium]|nr:ATP synthase F1 subunit delta [Clostridia bacterium]